MKQNPEWIVYTEQRWRDMSDEAFEECWSELEAQLRAYRAKTRRPKYLYWFDTSVTVA